jgi:hypothetical protein
MHGIRNEYGSLSLRHGNASGYAGHEHDGRGIFHCHPNGRRRIHRDDARYLWREQASNERRKHRAIAAGHGYGKPFYFKNADQPASGQAGTRGRASQGSEPADGASG